MQASGMTTIEVKKYNRKKVYELIYKEKSIPKQEISLKLNMGLTTVTQNLKALEEEGLICRTGYFESTGGRKAQAIEIVKDASLAVGVFILRRKIILTLVNLYGETVDRLTAPCDFSASDGYYRFLGEQVLSLINRNNYDCKKISGVGIAIQGVVSSDGKMVKYGRLLEQTGLLAEDLARYIPFECRLVHDSKAAAYAEIWNKSGINDALVLLFNKNLGSALVVNRKVHNGKSMHSGTIEHMRVAQNGRKCYCGDEGCLEAYCSADSLQQQLHGMSFDAFFREVRNGSEVCRAIWDEFLSALTLAIRNASTIIDGDIIISGFLAPYFTEDDFSLIRQKLRKMPFFEDCNLNLTMGRYGEMAPAIGAALHYIKKAIANI